MSEETPWQRQRAAMLHRISSAAGKLATEDFLKLRGRLMVEHAGELKTKRQVLDSLLKKYDKLSRTFHKLEGTTYEGWCTYGPKAAWDETVEAARDDSVWDRLVERVQREHADRKLRPHAE